MSKYQHEQQQYNDWIWWSSRKIEATTTKLNNILTETYIFMIWIQTKQNQSQLFLFYLFDIVIEMKCSNVDRPSIKASHHNYEHSHKMPIKYTHTYTRTLTQLHKKTQTHTQSQTNKNFFDPKTYFPCKTKLLWCVWSSMSASARTVPCVLPCICVCADEIKQMKILFRGVARTR